MRPSNGQEYINMARAVLSKLIIISFGLKLSVEESVSNNCGRLYYDEPAVLGRNVTLKYEPVQVSEPFVVEWETLPGKHLRWWSVVSEEHNYHLDNFSLVINTSIFDQERQFGAIYGSCSSEVITLKLEVIDINSCGMWYERTSNVRPGGTVELGYLPTWKIIDLEANYRRIFQITNSTFPDGCQIQDLPGVYEIRALGYNHEYVLGITLSETFVNGRYRVKCTTGRQEDKYTEYINVTIPERPNKPELLDTQSFEDCRNCIVGNLNDNLDIKCYVTGGTAPLQVNITVGGKSTHVFSTNEGVYVVNIQLTTTRHMTNVTCSVSNIALDSLLISEASLYILVRPPEPVFDVPELRDDAPLTYPTCTSSGARPPSDVEFKSSNSEIHNASRTTRTKTANLYNTSVTLVKMEKYWNLQNLTCCVNHRTYTSPWCRTKQLIYKFKPQSVRVSLVDNYTAILPYYTYNVTCIVRRAYPACFVTWVWPEGVDKLDSTESFDGTNVITTYAELSLNVSRKDNGKEVTCKAVCAEVDFNQADVHVIFVPFYNCGRLSYNEPAVMGKLVTLTFEPVQVVSNVPVIWRTSPWSTVVSEQWNYHLDNFSLVINTTTDDQGRGFFATYGSCVSSYITLKLEVYNCGRLSYNEPAVMGKLVTLTFEPVQVVSNVPVIWRTSPWSTVVSEQWNYHLDNFSLVINTTTDDQGRGFFATYGSCVSSYITLKLEDLPDEPTLTWYGVLGFSKMIAIIIITSSIVILLAAVILGVVCIRRRTCNKSEVLHYRGAAAGADNREADERNEEIHEYEEMHEYEGLAERGPSHTYEGLAERGASHAYEGLADRGSSHAYEGLANRGPFHAYEGLADRGSSHAYEGLAESGPAHTYEGLANIGPSHAYEALAERGSSHAYESMNTESKTVTTTHEERVYMN